MEQSSSPLLPHTALSLLSCTSQAVPLVAFSIKTAQNPFGFIKNPLRSQLGLSRGPTRSPKTITESEEPPPADFQLCRALKPLMNLDFIGKKKVANPYLFRCAPMVTTFVLSTGNRTKAVWNFHEKASWVDIRLGGLEHASLKNMSFCSGRLPIYIFPSFYSPLKLWYPIDVVGVSRDCRVKTELVTGFLRHAVSILTADNFWTVVDSG